MSDYWKAHLKRNNAKEVSRISVYYPKEKVLNIDVKKIIDNDIWVKTLERPGSQAEDIVVAFKELVTIPKEEWEIHNFADVIVRFYNVKQKKRIKNLRTEDEAQLTSIKALVRQVSEVRPKVTVGIFTCEMSHHIRVTNRLDKIEKPIRCNTCDSTRFEYVPLRSVKVDRQWISIQDPLEEMSEGGVPSSLKCELLEDLCWRVFPGERVIVNGVYRTKPIYKGRELTGSEDIFFEVSSIESTKDDDSISTDDEMKIIELSKSPELFDKLATSIAPSILDMKLMKRAIVLQLIEGVERKLKDGTVRRGFINVLVVSDPGMAKSLLLKFVSRLHPRGVFTTATTSTRVGLVAPVVRDEETGEYSIQAGAYMIASGGILCLDEISELSPEDFKYFNESMEDGEAHITKAGMNITVTTKCGLLAACNPTRGSFDTDGNLADQVKIPDPTLSRFDLKILYTDKVDDTKDGIMVDHIADSYMNSETESTHISPDLLRKYIAYARRIKPELTKEATKKVHEYYRSIRKDSIGLMKVTIRQIPSIIRLAEAHAKMRLSTEVTELDAEEAIWIFNAALRSVAGAGDGHIDMAKVERKHKFGLVDTILKVIKNGTDGKASEGEILMETAKHKYESEKVCRVIRELCNEGKIMQPKNGIYKVL